MFYVTEKMYVVLHYFVFELNYVCKQTEPPYKTQLMLTIWTFNTYNAKLGHQGKRDVAITSRCKESLCSVLL